MLHELIRLIAQKYGPVKIDYDDKRGYIVSVEIIPGKGKIKTGWSCLQAVVDLFSELENF